MVENEAPPFDHEEKLPEDTHVFSEAHCLEGLAKQCYHLVVAIAISNRQHQQFPAAAGSLDADNVAIERHLLTWTFSL